MAKPTVADPLPAEEPLGLDAFKRKPAEEGLSLDRLSQAFRSLLGSGDDPYSVPMEPADDPIVAELELDAQEQAGTAETTGDDACQISPRSILEAMLFVGTPDNQPLESRKIASFMRGVRPAEIDDLVRDLNAGYASAGCPYTIASQGSGYRLTLRPDFAAVRDRFLSRPKAAKLSPAAIEVLAAVAYNEPLAAEDIAQLRGTSSGAILSQLVRRQLLRLDRGGEKPRYYTTARFLEVFGLAGLEDLPRGQDV